MKGTNSSLWWLLLVGTISLLLCAPFFRAVYNLPDEGIFLRGAELMLRGKRLYADFFEFLPPGSFLLTAAWFDIAGISLDSARTLAMLTIVGIACFTFLACRQASKSALLSASLAGGWVMMTQWHWMQVSHHWFTTFFAMVAAWAALASLEQAEPRSLRWPLIAGLAAGAATMVTETRGAWTVLVAMTAFVGLRQNRSELVAYVLGGILVFAGVIAFLAGQQTLVAAFNDVIAFAVTRYAPIQYEPYAHGASIFDWPLIYVFPVASLLLLLVIARDWRACLHDRRLRLCAAFAFGGFLGCFPRPDIAHVAYAVPLALPLVALGTARLARSLRPTSRYAFAAVVMALCTPSAIAFGYVARTALHAPVLLTPRGKAAFLFSNSMRELNGVTELLPIIATTPSRDGFFFYPQMPLLSFLAAREHVAKYEYFIPWYTTPAQYRDACLSVVRDAAWVVTDRRFADYKYWKQIYPSMPDAKPLETIRFEGILDRAFELVTTKGSFELRHHRQGIRDGVCDAITARGLERNSLRPKT